MKFTDEGSVTIMAELVELDEQNDYASPSDGPRIPHILFRVVDTGIGMSKETVRNLFQRFYQGRENFERKVGSVEKRESLGHVSSCCPSCLPASCLHSLDPAILFCD